MQVYSYQQVREQNLTIIGDQVLDLKGYNKSHPGGEFLELFEGRNITLSFAGAHLKSAKAKKVLSAKTIGTVDQATIPESDKDLTKLFDKYQSLGYFKTNYKSLVARLTISFTLFGLGIYLQDQYFALAFILLTLGILSGAWIIHNAGHFSEFKNENHNRWLTEILGITLLGSSQETYHTIDHRIHHGVTNTINHDGATKIANITWNEKQYESKTNHIPFFIQPLLWFLVVLPLTFPALLISTTIKSIVFKKYVPVLLLLLRWPLFYFFVFNQNLTLTLLPVVVAGYFLALFSSLNHYHMKMDTKLEEDFASQVFLRTQNIKNYGAVISWLTGGLNYHIEHHFFPTMNPCYYPLIQKDIKSFAKKHNLPYHEDSLMRCIAMLFNNALNPLKKERNIEIPKFNLGLLK